MKVTYSGTWCKTRKPTLIKLSAPTELYLCFRQ